MSSRLIRQLTIILIIIGVIGAVIFFIWYRNRPEEVVPPPVPEGPEYEEISTDIGQLIKNDTAWDYIIMVENLNDSWVLESFNYELKINDIVVPGTKGSDYLNVLEEKPIIITRLDLEDSSAVPDIEFSNLEWAKPNPDLGNLDLIIKSQYAKESFIPSGKKTDLVGIVQNRTDYDLAMIELYVQALDRDGKLIAVNKSSVGPVSASKRKQFNMQWINADIDSTTVFDIMVTSNFYNESNILESGGISRQEK